jgi:hypothetical protein
MPTDLSELRGELLALRCYVAALIQVLPLSSQLRLPAAFENRADLIRDQLDESGQAGFARAATSLAVRRREVSRLASVPGTGQRP